MQNVQIIVPFEEAAPFCENCCAAGCRKSNSRCSARITLLPYERKRFRARKIAFAGRSANLRMK